MRRWVMAINLNIPSQECMFGVRLWTPKKCWTHTLTIFIYVHIYMIYGGRESDLETFSVVVDTVKTVNVALWDLWFNLTKTHSSLKYIGPKTCTGLFYWQIWIKFRKLVDNYNHSLTLMQLLIHAITSTHESKAWVSSYVPPPGPKLTC